MADQGSASNQHVNPPQEVDERLNEEVWLEDQSEFIIQLMDKEFLAGRIVNFTFNSSQLRKFSLRLFRKFRIRFSEDAVKRKIKNLKQGAKLFGKLIDAEGFNWNSRTETLTAPENIWNKYDRVPRSFIETGQLAYYESLFRIFDINPVGTRCEEGPGSSKRARHSGPADMSISEWPTTEAQHSQDFGKLSPGYLACFKILQKLGFDGIDLIRAVNRLEHSEASQLLFLNLKREHQIMWVRGLR